MAARTQLLVDPRPTASEPIRSVEENRFSLRLDGFGAESKSRERTKSVRVTPSSLAQASHSSISSGARRTERIFVIRLLYYTQGGQLSNSEKGVFQVDIMRSSSVFFVPGSAFLVGARFAQVTGQGSLVITE